VVALREEAGAGLGDDAEDRHGSAIGWRTSLARCLERLLRPTRRREGGAHQKRHHGRAWGAPAAHRHRSPRGTPARTCSTWAPQPENVALRQEGQVTRMHIVQAV
jgi:hypothetical protein